jgi:hypothetical protein
MTAARTIAFVLATSVLATGCFGGRGGGFRLFEAALITTAIVSAIQPPPPRVVFVPEPRPGFVWQAGYWTQQDGQWVWVDGQWIQQQPNAAWQPTHWEQTPDGQWRLVPGQWVAVAG